MEIKSNILKESYTKIVHKSGLTLLLYPKEQFKTSYAMITAGIGSIDNTFTIEGEETIHVPDGVAHFLEHKLFESEDGDSFQQYSALGASANAYTTFDRTAYYFSCTENFKESLKVLVEQCTHPYFTAETVQKEQGIIGQEIRMYEDDPSWRVYFNLLCSLFNTHPIRIDIAGTKESIAEITDKTLYTCHRAFYNLNNMVLTCAGNFKVEEVLEVCDELLSADMALKVTKAPIIEDENIVKPYAFEAFPVAAPIFQLGFKGVDKGFPDNFFNSAIGEIVTECIAGEGSNLYRELYDKSLINTEFDTEIMAGPSYMVTMFAGESKNPRLVAEKIKEEIRRMQNEGIDRDSFVRGKKCCYGRYVDTFTSCEGTAFNMAQCHFAQEEPYSVLERLASVTLNEAQAFLRENLDLDKCALSIVAKEEL